MLPIVESLLSGGLLFWTSPERPIGQSAPVENRYTAYCFCGNSYRFSGFFTETQTSSIYLK